ncbi:DNA polymerase III subunit gamma/tau [Nodularia phage vB_NspS-kac65v162]|jgi:DNA polymerase III subunit gamma/tau|uniref:DNA-directed DNA polymerase n=3 Tax=Ravarandavirus kac65v151 TaxID=2845689 RepID=A0A482MJT4_9CAUD|nr:clamp loader of DNA polymerase [Nodularia phage vB_NspS-kac65v151]QBQ73105.1 DNA polymerase III subunit gamma/tau [Nodularia phage vB_NspS-kac65v151]QBQ73313.1 DNA polymerase III subunit gamma/tau [Nodularia phage vB_NspS-kac65v161]QBQ73519.1 DNA polymerase III subunit gamma/tau [Nodularia phage vB_NspS-kac65v162]
MSLVNKYRPQKLSQIVGQRSTVMCLKNAINRQTLHPAYLFSGERGTGKTSTARVIAKSLNCQRGLTTEPCGECSNCKSIQSGGASLGVNEIDCATNNGVDFARDLVSKIYYAPMSNYKVYVFDEAHNLTRQAFDALLKCLEDSGSKVIFILVTTEPNKIPKTVQSRCQHFQFTPPSHSDVVNYLRSLLALENLSVSDEILELITEHTDGVLREALTLLDKIALSGFTEVNDVYELLNKPQPTDIHKLLECCVKQDYQGIYRELKAVNKSGADPLKVLGDIANFIRNAIVGYSKPDYKLMTTDTTTFKLASQWGRSLPQSTLVDCVIMLRKAEIDFIAAKFPKLYLESVLLELSKMMTLTKNEFTSAQSKPTVKQLQQVEMETGSNLITNCYYNCDNPVLLTLPEFEPVEPCVRTAMLWQQLCQTEPMNKLRTKIVEYQWYEQDLMIVLDASVGTKPNVKELAASRIKEAQRAIGMQPYDSINVVVHY